MNVLVTGGCGFIGDHLVRGLCERGIRNLRITIFDNFLSYYEHTSKFFVQARDAVKHPKEHELWMKKVYLLRSQSPSFLSQEEFDAFEFDVIFHLGATASVVQCELNPLASHENNVGTTLRLLELCRLAKKKPKFIFWSSSAVYGNEPDSFTDLHPTTVDTIHNAISQYGLQKSICEQYINYYSKTYGIPVISLRYANVFGPGQNPTGAYPNVIAAWSDCLLNNRPLRLDGEGKQARDFVYVDDVVSANIKAMKVLSGPDQYVRAYNVGSGKARRIIDILAMFRELKPDIQVEYGPRRPGDPDYTCLNSAETQDVFDIDLGSGDFKQQLKETIESYGVKL